MKSDRVEARLSVMRAVADGSLVKGPCSVCGITRNVHGHHEDYAEPLNVQWLCAAHHAARHGARVRAGLETRRRVDPGGRLLTAAAAAVHCGLTERAFRRLIARAAIPVKRLGVRTLRFDPRALECWMRESARAAERVRRTA